MTENPYTIKLRVWGDFACFTRPEMKVERVSYDVMTPSAARGILEAIYWKPQFTWVILSIQVLKPVRFSNIRRNELGRIAGKPTAAHLKGESQEPFEQFIEEERQQRASTLLCDVAYLIEATFDLRDARFDKEGPPARPHDALMKHREIFRRRASKGQVFQQPYFGTREFPAYFELHEGPRPECPPELLGTKDLGYMLHDMVFSPDKKGKIIESNQGQRINATPVFFRANLQDGLMTVPSLQSNEVKA